MKKTKKRKLKIGRIIVVCTILIAVIFLLVLLLKGTGKIISKEETKFLASNVYEVVLYDYDKENQIIKENQKVVRGLEVKAKTDDGITIDEKKYIPITFNKENYYVLDS